MIIGDFIDHSTIDIDMDDQASIERSLQQDDDQQSKEMILASSADTKPCIGEEFSSSDGIDASIVSDDALHPDESKKDIHDACVSEDQFKKDESQDQGIHHPTANQPNLMDGDNSNLSSVLNDIPASLFDDHHDDDASGSTLSLVDIPMSKDFDTLIGMLASSKQQNKDHMSNQLALDQRLNLLSNTSIPSSNKHRESSGAKNQPSSPIDFQDMSSSIDQKVQSMTLVDLLGKVQSAIAWVSSLTHVMKWIFFILIGLTILWLVTGILSWLGLWSYWFASSMQSSSPNLVIEMNQNIGWTDAITSAWSASRPNSRVAPSQALHEYMKQLIDDYTSGRIGKSKITPGASESCYKMLESGRFSILPQIHQQLTILDICAFDHKQQFLNKAQQYFGPIYPHEYQKFIQLVESHWDANQE